MQTDGIGVDGFRELVAAGRGAAIQVAEGLNGLGFEDVVVEACLGDAQIGLDEEDRAPYLYELAGRLDVRRRVWDALRTAGDPPSARAESQRLDLAVLFARDGCEEAGAILDARATGRGEEPWRHLSRLVDAFGEEGLRRAAERILPEEDPKGFTAHFLLEDARDRLGADRVAALRDPAILRLVAAAEAPKPPWTPKPREPIDTLEVLLAKLADSDRSPASLGRGFRLDASDEEFSKAAARCNGEMDPRLREALKRAFSPRRPFPLDPMPLLEDGSEDALALLEGCRDERVAVYARHRLEEGDVDGEVLGLLEAHVLPSDVSLVLRALDRTRLPLLDPHSVVLAFRSLAKTLETEGAELLRWAYDHSPCSVCQGFAIADLIELGGADEDRLREALYDADPYARESAAKALGVAKPF